MENKPKTHYRKVFKSDHLGIADLEEYQEQKHNLIFTISHVKQEIGVRVAGKKINGNIAYFVEGIKPLVLNATNSKVIKTLTGSSFLEDWAGVAVQLYIDPNVSMKGEVVGGVRINPNPVRLQKRVITPEDKKLWARAVNAYKRDGNLLKVLQSAEISEEHQNMIWRQANDA